MKLKNKNTLLLSIAFIVFGAAARLISILPNFSPFESLALFGGAYLASRYIAILIPIAAIFLTDLFINNTIARSFYPDHEGFVIFSEYMIWTYLSMIAIVFFSRVALKKVSFTNVLSGVVGATVIFFIVTNFGSWMSNPMYSKDFGGLMASYAAGLPFLKNSFLGNLVFSAILFGGFEMIKSLQDNGTLATEKVES